MARKHGSQKVQELDIGQKIQVKQYGGGPSSIVESPLPESFGFSSGSQFGSPFASYRSGGLLSQIGAISGFSTNFGLFTRKFYEGPQESQVSFDMKFDTWEDSIKDVIIPVTVLMIFSTGYEQSKLTTAEQAAASIMKHLSSIIPQTAVNIENTVRKHIDSNLPNIDTSGFNYNIFQMLHTPPEIAIRFGNAFTLREMFLSNVSLQFSNVLDNNYIPMSCTASITADYKNPLTQGKISNAFSKHSL